MTQSGEMRLRSISTHTSTETSTPAALVSAVRRIFRPTANRIPKVIGPRPCSKALRQGECSSRFQLRQASTITKVDGKRMAASAP